MSDLRWLAILSLVPALLFGCGTEAPLLPPQKITNLILISIDTLRADHLGCYGYDRPTSPEIDQFAAQGLLFEDCSAPSPWTLPSHASILTGLYPSRHTLNSPIKYLPAHVLTMAEVLKKQGFSTAAIVNSLNVSRKHGLDRGFDTFSYVEEFRDQMEPSLVENHAVEWLSKNAIEPFFLFLHYYDVHSDYVSLPEYEKMFVRPYDGNIDGSSAQLKKFRRGTVEINQRGAEHLIDLYNAGIRQMDDGIARLLAVIKELQLLDKTLIVITSDHGEEFLEHGDILHGRSQYQELIHVPLIMSGPGLPNGKRIAKPVSLVDLMPTILALLDLPAQHRQDGLDLTPLWEDPDGKLPHRLIFAEADHNNTDNDIKRAVRHPQFKLHYDRLKKEAQLYDLVSDPGEKTDIRANEIELAGMLHDQLDQFLSEKETAESTTRTLSPKEIEKLKSFGYLQ